MNHYTVHTSYCDCFSVALYTGSNLSIHLDSTREVYMGTTNPLVWMQFNVLARLMQAFTFAPQLSCTTPDVIMARKVRVCKVDPYHVVLPLESTF